MPEACRTLGTLFHGDFPPPRLPLHPVFANSSQFFFFNILVKIRSELELMSSDPKKQQSSEVINSVYYLLNYLFASKKR